MDRHHRLNQPPRWFISATTIPPSVIALGFVVVPVAMLIVHAISIDAIGSTFVDFIGLNLQGDAYRADGDHLKATASPVVSDQPWCH